MGGRTSCCMVRISCLQRLAAQLLGCPLKVNTGRVPEGPPPGPTCLLEAETVSNTKKQSTQNGNRSTNYNPETGGRPQFGSSLKLCLFSGRRAIARVDPCCLFSMSSATCAHIYINDIARRLSDLIFATQNGPVAAYARSHNKHGTLTDAQQ